MHKKHKDIKQLDRHQLAVATAIMAAFKSQFTGSENSVKNEVLITVLANQYSINTTGREIRHVLGYIRSNDLLAPAYIVSDVSEGYWLTENESEMNSFLNKQLNRMSNQFQNIKSLHQRIRYAKKNTPEVQPHLF